MVFAGLMPRTGASLIAVVMAVAIAKVHADGGFFMKNGGFEYPFLILMNAIAIIFSGGGLFSIYDRY
jgi:putative oxidoreductase